MDSSRNKTVVLFLLMGATVIFSILYVFVILPNNNKSTLGSSDILLELPVQKWNIRYSEYGVLPFCKDDNNSLTFEVGPDTSVFSSVSGIVSSVKDNIITVEVSPGIYVEHFPVSNYTVFENDYITKGQSIGKVDGEYLNLRINVQKNELYECPYNFLNTFGKSIVDEVLELVEYEGNACECAILNY